ncbi:helix-turn-helix transcriptional regulator [Marivibrio halodurans]|uniref:Helix-turn-helix transcriptional regulator n=1 Tax=Marivibrio halodurans TaxID=2039722 RepID=A0A8J7UZD2_9PROT|nr:TetR/AcrR family transcriptional regulator [Marivibrio halodurans]MBP5855556.1 helix-turn-helix transcriptional regulator [Marivibrio halodurans]
MAARNLFARHGYSRTSLDALTDAMGINRSSFYASFGSKRDVLLRALESYCRAQYADFRTAIEGAPTPMAGARAMIAMVVNAHGGRHGCFAVNCIGELAPSDPEVDHILRAHMADSETLLADALSRAGASDPRGRAKAALALALGAIALRKAGSAPESIERIVQDGLDALFG